MNTNIRVDVKGPSNLFLIIAYVPQSLTTAESDQANHHPQSSYYFVNENMYQHAFAQISPHLPLPSIPLFLKLMLPLLATCSSSTPSLVYFLPHLRFVNLVLKSMAVCPSRLASLCHKVWDKHFLLKTYPLLQCCSAALCFQPTWIAHPFIMWWRYYVCEQSPYSIIVRYNSLKYENIILESAGEDSSS